MQKRRDKRERKIKGTPLMYLDTCTCAPPKGSDLGLKDDQETALVTHMQRAGWTCASETLANSSPLACCEADTGEHER